MDCPWPASLSSVAAIMPKRKSTCQRIWGRVRFDDSTKGLAERLLAVCDADELDGDLQKQLALVMQILNGLGVTPPSGKCATREKGPSDDLFGMSRR